MCTCKIWNNYIAPVRATENPQSCWHIRYLDSTQNKEKLAEDVTKWPEENVQPPSPPDQNLNAKPPSLSRQLNMEITRIRNQPDIQNIPVETRDLREQHAQEEIANKFWAQRVVLVCENPVVYSVPCQIPKMRTRCLVVMARDSEKLKCRSNRKSLTPEGK